MNGLYTVTFNEHDGRTEVTIISTLSSRVVGSHTDSDALTALVEAFTDVAILMGEDA